MHKHLTRIPVWTPPDRAVIYFITCCTAQRVHCLACDQANESILAAWRRIENWKVGRYVVMPDHVHFFISPLEREANLSKYIQAFRSLVTRQLRPLGYPYPLWQSEFFDHLLRSDESYEQKWHYVLNNPVRAGLVRRWEDWPYAGELHPLPL
ncbi:MAG: transposase [Verrucomicrobiia bacterium]